MDVIGYEQEMAEQLCSIAQEVFLLMVDIELLPCAVDVELESAVAAKLCYQTSPGTELELFFDRSLAFTVTQRLMSLDVLPVDVDDEVRDSVGEIVNMVGGNFHSILSPGAALDTTPLSSELRLEGRRVLIEVCLEGTEGAVLMRLTDTVS